MTVQKKFQSTNGTWRNWHSLRALTYSRWISDIWFPFPSPPKTVSAGSGAFQWNRLFHFLCYQFSISVCVHHDKSNPQHIQLSESTALLFLLAFFSFCFFPTPHPTLAPLNALTPPPGFISRNTPWAAIFTASSPPRWGNMWASTLSPHC